MTSSERVLLTLLALGAATSTPAILFAQGLTGQISGVAADSGGGVVPGASVTIQNAGTLLTRHATTGMEGTYVFPDLLAGTYDLTVALEGFKPAEQKGIVLASTDRLELRRIVLEVGGLNDTVTVTNAAPLVQTSNGARAATLTCDHFVQYRSVNDGQYERRVQLHDQGTDEPEGLRRVDRRDQQRPPHPARRAVYVLTGRVDLAVSTM